MQPSFGVTSTYPQPGDVLDGKYRVEHLLGEGGMGAVAKATHLLRRAPVALKFMSGAVLSMQGAVERFVNEGVAASQIDSDHVVKVFDVGRLPSGAPYLVMEYLDGLDLGQILEREGPTLPVPRAIHFTLQTLRALHTAHAAGIVHRDMKPSNVFVIERDGERDFVKLVDFGISKVRTADDGQAAPHLTRTNSALGTPLYMSPEQARSPRDVDHRTDLYSVGAILYEMLTGRTPYTSDTGEFTEILFKIFTTEPEPLSRLRPDLPEGLAAMVHRALTREPDGRFPTATDMAEALSVYADERSNQVIARLRTGRRSQTPVPLHSVTPLHEGSRATQSEATARTHAGSIDPPAPRPPSTEVGVTRDSAGTGGSTKTRTGILVAVVAGAVALGAGALVLRGHGHADGSTTVQDEPGHAASPGRVSEEIRMATPPPAPPPPPPATIETVVLAPESTGTSPLPPASARPGATASSATKLPPRPSGTPSSASAPNPTPNSTPPPGSPLPTQLGDLKLH
jgi:serine/threonine-protein kinase